MTPCGAEMSTLCAHLLDRDKVGWMPVGGGYDRDHPFVPASFASLYITGYLLFPGHYSVYSDREFTVRKGSYTNNIH